MIPSSPQPASEALMFRSAGLSYRDIARRQGVHPSTAYARVQKAMRDERHAQYESPADYRDLELSKLARLERTVLSLALQGDMAAARVVIRITEMRLKLMQIPTPTVSDELVDDMLRQPLGEAIPDDESSHSGDGEHPWEGDAPAESQRDMGASARREPRPPRDETRRAKDARPLTERELWNDACRILAMYAKPENGTDQNTNPPRQQGIRPEGATPEQKNPTERRTPPPDGVSPINTNPNPPNDLAADHRQTSSPANQPNTTRNLEPNRTPTEQKPNGGTKPKADSGKRKEMLPANHANGRE